MSSIADIVDLVHPTVSGTSVTTTDRIWVLFDREIDEATVAGNFFVAGPDQDTWSGPDLSLYQNYESVGTEDEVLQSPGYHGIVQGTFTFERIQNASLLPYTGYDYTGVGTNYRTKVIFTPTQRLAESTSYQVYITGDDDLTDDYVNGIRSRTVFDTVINTHVGTGTVTFGGSYTGDASADVFNVEIATAGSAGTAEFSYWTDSDLANVYGPYPTSLSPTTLADGVTVTFGAGTYEVGDAWEVIVRQPTTYTSNLMWPFDTGTGSVLTVPSGAATTLFGTPAYTPGVVVPSSTTFSVSETTPTDQQSNITTPVVDFPVIVEFTAAIDSATVSNSTVSVVAEPVNGDTTNSGILCSGVLAKTLSVSGDTLTITIPAGYLRDNNVVTVTLDKTISSTSSVSLGSDYSFYFTTSYYPLYSSIRKVRLDVGSFVLGIPDDTINLAIFEASLEADKLTWRVPAGDNEYYKFVRRQWTTCRAEEILLLNALQQGGGLSRKKLGDLEVQYDSKAINSAIDRALGCMAKWTPVLAAGGFAVQEPTYFIRGENDPDRPAVGRLWSEPDVNDSLVPAANSRSKASTSRRYRSGYYSRWGK